MRGENIFAEGTLLEAVEDKTAPVEMPNGHRLLAFLPGKMREENIPLLPGQKVMLEISPYDLSRGRITLRKN